MGLRRSARSRRSRNHHVWTRGRLSASASASTFARRHRSTSSPAKRPSAAKAGAAPMSRVVQLTVALSGIEYTGTFADPSAHSCTIVSMARSASQEAG